MIVSNIQPRITKNQNNMLKINIIDRQVLQNLRDDALGIARWKSESALGQGVSTIGGCR